MNCTDFTSSNGNRNGKRNYGAANCGARAKQHHNSSIDFLDRSVLEAAKHGQANADALTSSRQFFADRANPGDGTVVGTRVVLAQVFLVLTDKNRNCVSSMTEWSRLVRA
jgi:hypothetical protein